MESVRYAHFALHNGHYGKWLLSGHKDHGFYKGESGAEGGGVKAASNPAVAYGSRFR